MTEARTAWVVGATGLVGRETLKALLEDEGFARVVAITRRPTGLSHPRLEERLVDFDNLERELSGLHVDVAFCCLGTTIKQAGSKAQFRKVDHDYAFAFARAAHAAGVRHLIVVTALGASARAAVFYSRVKGELEQALAKLPVEQLTIVRPSLLLGERDQIRLGERLAAPFSRFFPARYRGIEGRTVARALCRIARESTASRRLVDSEELHNLGA